MIKVAIAGAETPRAGELIRLLLHHPDVEIVSLVAQGFEGKAVQTVHHGLIGETSLFFSGSLQPETVNLLFIAGGTISSLEFRQVGMVRPDLKIISFNPIAGLPGDTGEAVFALPEINRKSLVRGAGAAVIPSPPASLALVPLYPLALNMLLQGKIDFTIEAPEDIVSPEALQRAGKEIAEALCEAQRSFSGDIEFHTASSSSRRGMKITMELPCSIGIEHIMNMFEMYDDHHFAFPVMSQPETKEAVGTEKCIFSLVRTKEDTLRITAVADSRMRGAAGEAVHVMNLMFGLHEQTGLALKASTY